MRSKTILKVVYKDMNQFDGLLKKIELHIINLNSYIFYLYELNSVGRDNT